MTGPKRIDDCLSTLNGHLFIEECDTVDLIRQFGSPLFVYSENQIRRNVRRFQKAFQNGWPDGPVKILPAAKANWISAVQRILAEEDCGCDIYSPGELSIALNAGIEPQFISVNGVPKDEVGDILAMLDTGAYQEVSMSNFNAMPRPATVLVTGDQATIIRQREKEADMLRRDVMPEHLKRKKSAGLVEYSQP